MSLSIEPVVTVSSRPAPDGALKDAFEATRADREALADEARAQIIFDVAGASITILGALARVTAHRDDIVRLGGIGAERFDRLKLYAQSAAYAHAVWFATSRPTETLPELHKSAIALRDMLLRAADSAADKGKVGRDRLSDIRSGTGYRDTLQDLVALTAIFRGGWKELVGYTSVEAADLTEADSLAEQMLEALSLREGTNTALTTAAEDRVRAVTVMVEGWNEVRRALQFLRFHEGDADQIAPSIYVRASAGDKDEPASDGDDNNKNKNGGATPAEKPIAAGEKRDAATPPAGPAPQPGMPGSDPFGRK